MSDINPSHFEKIPTFPDDADDRYVVHAIIETPRNIRHKFALEAKYGIFRLSSTIAEGLEWPYDYGFIPQTLGDDGDPLDVLYLNDEPTFCGCLVQARIIGIIHLKKNGEENDRLIACAERCDGIAQSTDGYNDMDDVPKQVQDSLCRFLVEYSTNQDNKIKFKGVGPRKQALRAIQAGLKKFKKGRKK
jgi:inorganic pyrophosphatase